MSFEEYIRKNRDLYDKVEHTPSDEIWVGIDHARRRRSARTRTVWFSAAAVLLALVIARIAFPLHPSDTREITQLDSLLESREQSYYIMANEKMQTLNYKDLDRQKYGDIIREFEIADSMYLEIKNDINHNPDAEKAIELAIKYHERKLRILGLLEREIENQKRFEDNEKQIKL